jgi:uncharacterized protein YuzE
MDDKKITALIENSIPKFVAIEYPRFVEFLKVYYSQQENRGEPYEFLANLLNYANVDETTLEYLEQFSEQFLSGLPHETLAAIDKRNLIKNIKQFYQSVGTEASVKFLFRILFNEDISLYYPTVDILRASDGKWQNDHIIKVTNSQQNDEIKRLEGSEIYGFNSGARALVEKVKTYIASNGYYVAELFITQFDLMHPINRFQVNESVIGTSYDGYRFNERIYSIINDYEILVPGLSYVPGDNVEILSNAGVDAFVLVDEIQKGSIIGVEIINGGVGYAENEKIIFVSEFGLKGKAKITSVDENGSITGVDILNKGYSYERLPDIIFETESGTGAELYPVSTNIGAIKKLKFISFGVEYSNNDISSVNPFQNIFVYDKFGDFFTNDEIQGETSGATGTIRRISNNVYGVAINETDFVEGETITGPNGTAKIYKQSIAMINFMCGALGNYNGYFRNTDSFLNSNKFIQDSYYYQDFSYVINTTKDKSLWINPLKNTIHPAGSIVFGLMEKGSEIYSISIGGIVSPLLNTTEFYKFRFENQPQDDGFLSDYGNTQISMYLDYYLYELGWLSPDDYNSDPDGSLLNTERKSNICLGSDISIGDFEGPIKIDLVNYFLIDDSNTLNTI